MHLVNLENRDTVKLLSAIPRYLLFKDLRCLTQNEG